MQHLDNDMDDLFQRAAENYPLRTGNGDWESVAKKIADTTAHPEAIVPPPKRRNKKLIALAALLFILFFGWYLFQRTSYKIIHQNSDALTSNMNTAPFKSKLKNNDRDMKVEEPAGNISKLNTRRGNYRHVINATAIRRVAKMGNTSSYNMITPYQGALQYNGKTPKSYDYYPYFFSSENLRKQETQKLLEKLKYNTGEISNPGEKYSASDLKDLLPAGKNSINNTHKEKPVAQNKKKEVYFGLAAGPDLNRVHSKPFNFGFDLGLVLGYNIQSRLSLETGILIDRKNYTSDGSSFSMDKIRQAMPVGMTINNVASRSNVIEIPLIIKYKITRKKYSGFFVMGGLSSYIMTKENNKYNMLMNGNQEKLEGVYYKNNYRFPANVMIGAGYKHNISNYLDLTIAPYLKIPLQGVGVGSLPLTGTGLQIGITRRLR